MENPIEVLGIFTKRIDEGTLYTDCARVNYRPPTLLPAARPLSAPRLLLLPVALVPPSADALLPTKRRRLPMLDLAALAPPALVAPAAPCSVCPRVDWVGNIAQMGLYSAPCIIAYLTIMTI